MKLLIHFEYCFPQSIQEQKSIASFLDYKTSQIDTLIEKKEQLLKLLEEKRIALITHAITKGFNIEMSASSGWKSSGIDWLGDIPIHWGSKIIGYFFNIQLGKMLQPNSSNDEDVVRGLYICNEYIEEHKFRNVH